PPPVHAKLIREALAVGSEPSTSSDRPGWIICQKPFCRDLSEAEAIAAEVEAAGARLIIHENFRFQPWYRTLKEHLDGGQLGKVYQCRFTLRPGDGRGPDAYLARQPGFQTMPQFLIRETGVHFIDLFRWLFGEVRDVYADLRQLNPVIAGEDAGMLMMNHVDGTVSVFDGNRLQDHPADNHRLTMGELYLECEEASLRIDGYGRLWQRRFGESAETQLPLTHTVIEDEFGGGCVTALINHVIEAWQSQEQPVSDNSLENELPDYLQVIRLAEASYESATQGVRVSLPR
ncbi:MAG: gfo/Idh/MocA family oxidoreductase, partial [Gammaproteobacteria bacterium]|nr:gfo/Idh/MocA family oxidoreductase [Gammaproteobacteria bacterium]